jgi:hypothetical protein
MYKGFMSFLMMCLAIPCAGQDAGSRAVTPRGSFSNSLIVSANVGAFSGLGAEVKASILPQLNVRLGFSAIGMSYNMKNYSVDDDVEASVSAKLRFSKIHLLAEYRPFAKKSFRLVAGPSYFISNKMTVIVAPLSSYTYRRIEIAKEELGEVKGTIDWSGIAPYFGIGIGNSVPVKRFNITVDAGAYFLRRPKVTIDATKLLEPNKANEQQLSENLKNYRWVPQLQFNFNYKLFSKKII